MSSFDVTAKSLNLFPFGLQGDLTVQNLGPDLLFYDEHSSVSASTGMILAVGQSIVWSGKRPLFVVSRSFSRIRTVLNSAAPTLVGDKWQLIAKGQILGSGIIQLDRKTTGTTTGKLSSAAFTTLQVTVVTKTGFPDKNDPLSCTVFWYDDDDNFIRWDQHFLIIDADPPTTMGFQTIVKGPKFEFAFQNLNTIAPLAGPTLISIFGTLDRENPSTMVGLNELAGNANNFHEDSNTVSFETPANFAGDIAFSSKAPRMHASVRLAGNDGVLGVAYVLHGGLNEFWPTAGAPSGVLGAGMFIPIGQALFQDIYYVSVDAYVRVNFGIFGASYDQIAYCHFSFF